MRKFIMRRIPEIVKGKKPLALPVFQALSIIFAAFSRGASNLYFIIS